MSSLVVVGSVNVDMSINAPRHPKGGETLCGSGFAVRHGGKGANQAIAAARFGASICMIGCIGADDNGDRARENLVNAGVISDALMVCENAPTGVALITTAQGENTIVIDPAANYELTPALLEKHEGMLRGAAAVLVQHELRKETVEATARLCKKHDVPCILNPAPAFELSAATIAAASYITPNEHECAIAFGCDIERALTLHAQKLIVTLGKQGIRTRAHGGAQEDELRLAAHAVSVVDTTGAGDVFNGVFAASMVQGCSVKEALVYANAAAALSITRVGAQTAPYYEAVREFLST